MMSDESFKLAAGAFLASNVAYVGQLALNKPRTKADGDPHQLLQGVKVFRATDEELVGVTSLWNEDEKAVLVLFRSYG